MQSAIATQAQPLLLVTWVLLLELAGAASYSCLNVQYGYLYKIQPDLLLPHNCFVCAERALRCGCLLLQA
jgi:hypothetical protein